MTQRPFCIRSNISVYRKTSGFIAPVLLTQHFREDGGKVLSSLAYCIICGGVHLDRRFEIRLHADTQGYRHPQRPVANGGHQSFYQESGDSELLSHLENFEL